MSLIGAKWEVWNVLYYATLVTTNQLVHDSKILRFEMPGLGQAAEAGDAMGDSCRTPSK